jgi:predicted metal-dependent hydrolase
MTAQMHLGDLTLDVNFKDIKNVHLSVHPPAGRVTVSAPSRMKLETIRVYAITKLSWIRRQQRKLQRQDREAPREFLNNESHFFWGKRYLLRIRESNRISITAGHNTLILRVPAGYTRDQKQAALARWYRQQIRSLIPTLVARWSLTIGAEVKNVKVRKMKTKWGSCNHRSRTILLNTDLAKKPKECLEYVLVHEMVHLLEPTHNARFRAAMDRLMPNWRLRRDLMNDLQVSHQEWKL